MSTSIVSLVGKKFPKSEYGGSVKWFDSVLCPSNGCVYGIPNSAKHVIKFNPKDQSSIDIGDDLGNDLYKWSCGVFAPNNNCIYAVPDRNERTILKIDTTNDTAKKLDVELPEVGGFRWRRGALADDGCIYYFPYYARRILKINPFDDTVSSVGNDLGDRSQKYCGTVKAKDGCLIGIPFGTKRILKFDPINPNNTSMVGEEADENFMCHGNGALGNDGIIYAVNKKGKILAIDVDKESHSFVATAPQSIKSGWCGAIAGEDGNIYFPPYNASRVLKYDITTKKASLVGEDLGDDKNKYYGGSVKTINGKIYCIPNSADQVLTIDTNAQDLSHKNANGGIHDSPHGDPDRLGYDIYAKGLSNVVQEIESPNNSVSVAIYAPWGTGKSFLYNRVQEHHQKRAILAKEDIAKESAKKIANEDPKRVNIFQETMTDSLELVFNIASFLHKVLCCSCCSNNTEAESIAAFITIPLFWPIGIIFFILGYMFHLLTKPIRSLVHSRKGGYGTVARHERTDKQQGGNSQDSDLENQRDAINTSMTQNSSHEVWKILSGKTSLHSNKLFTKRSCSEKVRYLFLNNVRALIAMVQGLWPSILSIRWGKEYKVNENLTKYIFINLNAWVYNGADDLIWASLLEEMWSKVEEECGKYNVRLHRAKIAISGEGSADDTETRRSKRDAAMMNWYVRVIASLVLSIVGAVLFFIDQPDFIQDFLDDLYAKIIAQVAATVPFVMVVIEAARKIIPYLLKSKGAEILKKASSLGDGDKYKRVDFSKKTGFMGEVKQEVEYLFDFIRTTHAQDDELKSSCPYRLSIFVDDLDRCNAETIMEVLEMVILLLVDAPVTCWLAIDSRLVVASIEKAFGGLFTAAGLDGYKFLEKIVQLPFCIPDLNETSKINYVEKILKKKELDPLRIYKRGRFLAKNGNKQFKVGYADFFDVDLADDQMSVAVKGLINTFKRMIERGVFGNEITNPLVKSPVAVNKEIEKLDLNSSMPFKSKECEEEFLYYVSDGIERILESPEEEFLYYVSDGIERILESPESKRDKGGKTAVDPGEVPTVEPSDPPITSNRTTLPNQNNALEQSEEGNINSSLGGYEELYRPMADRMEMKSFRQYAKMFIGEPRKIKRIINSYMLSRFIAEKMKPRGTMTPVLKDKLLRLIVLCEQWPYRMAWLMIVVKNLQQEKDMMSNPRKAPKASVTLGDIFNWITTHVAANQDTDSPIDLPLIDVYHYIVEVLIHSPKDAHLELQRDGDPQVFEQLLSEVTEEINGSQLRMSDIAFADKKESQQQPSIRPYVYNLQRHMIEKVQGYIDDCVLFLPSSDDKIKVIKYEMKSDVFRNHRF